MLTVLIALFCFWVGGLAGFFIATLLAANGRRR